MVTLSKPGAYKKPRRINGVSISLILMLGVAVYVAMMFWPALLLQANVKSLMDDALPLWYRANLYSEPVRSKEKNTQRAELIKRIKALKGMEDLHFQVALDGDKKTVWIKVDFETMVVFQGVKTKKPIKFHPRVETDAARVNWD